MKIRAIICRLGRSGNIETFETFEFEAESLAKAVAAKRKRHRAFVGFFDASSAFAKLPDKIVIVDGDGNGNSLKRNQHYETIMNNFDFIFHSYYREVKVV